MFHVPAVQHYLWDILRGQYSDVIKPTSVTVTLAETSKRMWYPNEKLKKKLSSYINPSKLINRLEDINCMMSEWQQDAFPRIFYVSNVQITQKSLFQEVIRWLNLLFTIPLRFRRQCSGIIEQQGETSTDCWCCCYLWSFQSVESLNKRTGEFE